MSAIEQNRVRRYNARRECHRLIQSQNWCDESTPVGQFADRCRLGENGITHLRVLTYSVLHHYVNEAANQESVILFSLDNYEEYVSQMRVKGAQTREREIETNHLDPQWLSDALTPELWSAPISHFRNVADEVTQTLSSVVNRTWNETKDLFIVNSASTAWMSQAVLSDFCSAVHSTVYEFYCAMIYNAREVVVMSPTAFTATMQNAFMSGYMDLGSFEWVAGDPMGLVSKP